MLFAATWMDPDIIIISEVLKKELSYNICGIFLNDTYKHIYKAETDSQT